MISDPDNFKNGDIVYDLRNKTVVVNVSASERAVISYFCEEYVTQTHSLSNIGGHMTVDFEWPFECRTILKDSWRYAGIVWRDGIPLFGTKRLYSVVSR